MHNISNEAFEEPSASTTYEELLKSIGANLERKYGIVSTFGSYVTSVPKDKIEEVKEGIENSKRNDKETIDAKKEEKLTENAEDNSENMRKATGEKSRVAVAPDSIMHRIKNNFGKTKDMKDDNQLNLKENKAKITRMFAHIITLPTILKENAVKGIKRHSIKKVIDEIDRQYAEIDRLRRVINKQKLYNEYQKAKIEDRNRRKEEIMMREAAKQEENREELERQERLAAMEAVNERDEKERLAKLKENKADFKYALKQQAKEQRHQDDEEDEILKSALEEMNRERKEQQKSEIEKLNEELEKLNLIMEKNYDKIDELERQEDEVKGRKPR